MKIGILNEKPSQARNFVAALGSATGKYNGEEYVIVAARGHLYEYVEPSLQVPVAKQAQYKSWNLANLPWDEHDFAWKRAPKDDTASTLKSIKAALSQCDEICIATDNDPTGEGELLAWEILSELGFKPKKWSRMYFEDESKKEIQKAFVNRKPIQSMSTDPDYIKALYRSQWDMLSMQWTRIATKCGDGKTVLREGRLKSAMKKLVGDQLVAVSNYVKKPFYQNRFKDENGIVYINPEEPQFDKKSDVPNNYHDSDVVVDTIERKTSAPPKLLDMAGLAARVAPMGISAAQTKKLMQSLYEHQFCSYPRTEDECVTPEQFNDLLPLVDKIADLVGVDKSLLTHRQPRDTHVKTGCAHGANRPGLNVPSSLSQLDAQFGTGASLIYVTLAKNYLSILGEDYEYEYQKGHVKDYPKFVGTASIPKKLGYKAIFSDADDDEVESDTCGLGKHANPFIHEGFPPKPQQPTMKWLMKQLKKYDVGTGATRTATYAEISNAKDPSAIFKDTKGKITMTDAGWMGYKLLPGTHIGDLKTTEKVMADMRAIAKGEADFDACLHEIQQMIRDDMEIMKQNSTTMRKEMNITMSDTSNTQPKEKYEGAWNGQPVKFTREWGGHRFTDDECEKLCAGEEIIVDGLVSKDGKPYAITGKLNNLSYNGHKYVGFERTGFANTNKAEIPAEWCKHVFTADEKLLLEAGKVIELDGCISKKGNIFACKVRWGKNEKGYMAIIPEF